VTNLISKNGVVLGVEVDGERAPVSDAPELEFYSKTLKDWKWPEYTIPGYIKSHVHSDNIDVNAGEMLLLPTFRLPTLIHTRSGNAGCMRSRIEIWINPKMRDLEVKTGDLSRSNGSVTVDKVWVTEGIKPVACSHHLTVGGCKKTGGERWSTAGGSETSRTRRG
jgi:hypothetical protein